MSKQAEIELAIRGMTCDHCAVHVTEALTSVPGVQEVNVPGWKSRRAVVVADTAVTDAELAAAVQQRGYGASVTARKLQDDL